MLTAASQHRSKPARLHVVMGVAGSGKSSIGEALAIKMGGRFIDGDHLHPQSNIDKMSKGQPLTDADRLPWLRRVGEEVARLDGIGLVGCSALKKAYRELITRSAGEPVVFVYLHGSKELIASRMATRQGHFMPTSLLDSQFATLEVPDATENAIHVNIDGPIDVIVNAIVTHIDLGKP